MSDTSTTDRTVHGYGNDGANYEVVRYDRAGKWFIEYPGGVMIPCRQVSLREAVRLAQTKRIGLPGGGAFDRLARKATDR